MNGMKLNNCISYSALAVHVSGSKIYWSDSKTKTINRCSVNGSNMEKVLEWMGLVEGMFERFYFHKTDFNKNLELIC